MKANVVSFQNATEEDCRIPSPAEVRLSDGRVLQFTSLWFVNPDLKSGDALEITTLAKIVRENGDVAESVSPQPEDIAVPADSVKLLDGRELFLQSWTPTVELWKPTMVSFQALVGYVS